MALFLFMFYTITMSYRGSLSSILTVTLIPQPVETIKDLAIKMENEVIWLNSFKNICSKNNTFRFSIYVIYKLIEKC